MYRAFLLCLLLLPMRVFADLPGLYAGGLLGLSHLDDDGMGDRQDFNEGGGMASIHAGYQFSPYAALQLNLEMLGGHEGETVTADSYSSYSGITLSILPRVSLDSGVSVYGELGGGLVSVYQWIDGTIGAVYYDDETELNTAPAYLYGLGFSYDLPAVSGLQLRVGYRRTCFETDAWSITNTNVLVESEHEQVITQLYAGASYYF